MSEGINEECGEGWPPSWITPFILPLQPLLYLTLGCSKKEISGLGEGKHKEEGWGQKERATQQQGRKESGSGWKGTSCNTHK